MRRRPAAVLVLAALIAGPVLGGCGSDPTSELKVDEGEPVKLGDLLYNVQITRPLNAADPEDKAYLAGQPPQPNDKLYLGVFMEVENQGGSTQTVPADFKILDTQGTEFKPIPSQSLFALEPGSNVPPGQTLPEPETTAASGPIQGSMVLFLIDQTATDNRPLTLEIPSASGGVGEVELDI